MEGIDELVTLTFNLVRSFREFHRDGMRTPQCIVKHGRSFVDLNTGQNSYLRLQTGFSGDPMGEQITEIGDGPRYGHELTERALLKFCTILVNVDKTILQLLQIGSISEHLRVDEPV